MFTYLLLLLSFFSAHEPCPCCKGKGQILEYRIEYEVHDPDVVRCPICKGNGWNTRKIP